MVWGEGGGRALPETHPEAPRELWLLDIMGFALRSQQCPIFLLNLFSLPMKMPDLWSGGVSSGRAGRRWGQR